MWSWLSFPFHFRQKEKCSQDHRVDVSITNESSKSAFMNCQLWQHRYSLVVSIGGHLLHQHHQFPSALSCSVSAPAGSVSLSLSCSHSLSLCSFFIHLLPFISIYFGIIISLHDILLLYILFSWYVL